MPEMRIAGEPEITVHLKRSTRAQRMSLRVSRLNGRVTLTLPNWAPETEARLFATQRADWIRGHLREQPDVVVPQMEGLISVEGKDRRIVQGTARRVTLSDDQIAVPGPVDRVPARLQGFLKALARERLAAASDQYCAVLGLRYHKLTLRDTRSRWGSCSSEGNLMYSWRLIMAPVEVLQYVAAHEVAHLREMNHAPEFWSVVEKLYPAYKRPRHWLREHGHHLHRYRFGD
ncbi:MAG: SprT family zinc-dependent metalloprotease [Pseudoruegeria sp.]